MNAFAAIFEQAAAHHGGAEAIEARMTTPRSAKEIAATPDDRWLSAMTKCIFQAGFSWKVIEAKWQGFEEAFDGFDLARWSAMHDEDLDRLVKDARVVRNGQKLASVGPNARYLAGLAAEHGSAGAYFAAWRPEDYVANLTALRTGGSRMGGMTGQMFLRRMGVDSPAFSKDMVAALVREGVIDKAPTSAKALRAIQAALDAWREESGRPLTQISQILALSVG